MRRRRSRSLSCQSRSVVSFVRSFVGRPPPTPRSMISGKARGRVWASARERRRNERWTGPCRVSQSTRPPSPPPSTRARSLRTPPPPLSLSSQSCKVERAGFVRSGTAKPNFLGKTSPRRPISPSPASLPAVRRRQNDGGGGDCSGGGGGAGGPRQSGKAMSPGKKRERGSGNEKYWSHCCCCYSSTMNRALASKVEAGWIGRNGERGCSMQWTTLWSSTRLRRRQRRPNRKKEKNEKKGLKPFQFDAASFFLSLPLRLAP